MNKEQSNAPLDFIIQDKNAVQRKTEKINSKFSNLYFKKKEHYKKHQTNVFSKYIDTRLLNTH